MSIVKPLTAHLVGWQAKTTGPTSQDPGYYEHQGRVYITGAINNSGGAVGATIMSGMPAAIRPSEPTKVMLPIIPGSTIDAANPALNLPIEWPSTVHPDGTWTLDEGVPASVNTPPPEAEWYYEDGFGTKHPQYTEKLNLALALGNVSWKVAALSDVYTLLSLAAFIGNEYTNVDAEYAIHGNRVHLAGHATAKEDGSLTVMKEMPEGMDSVVGTLGDYTTAHHGGNLVVLFAAPDLNVESDGLVVPSGDTPALRAFPFERLKRGVSLGIIENAEPGTIEWQVSDILGTEERECHPPEPQPPFKFSFRIPYTPGFGPGEHVEIEPAQLLAMCDPLPDWCFLSFTAGTSGFVRGEEVVGGPFCTLVALAVHAVLTGCPAVYDPTTGEPISIQELFTETGELYSLTLPNGCLKPPVSLYKGTPHSGKPGLASLLWTPAQVEALAAFTVKAYVVNANEFGSNVSMAITPFWERREIGLHEGDTLDLTGTGWEDSSTFVDIEALARGEHRHTRHVVGRTLVAP